jgi:diguanylate cyclase (GGDEF)-like protein/PAS domain S-box-containing protein
MPRPPKNETKVESVLRRLTEPPVQTSGSLRVQARLLSYLLLFLIISLIIIFPIILDISSFRNSTQFLTFLVVFILLCLAYGLSRTKYYSYAAILTVSILLVGTWMLAATDILPNAFAKDLFYLAIPIIFCSLLLRARVTALIAVITLGAVAGTGIAFPRLMAFSEWIALVIFLFIVAALSIAATFLRQGDQQEIERQSISLRQSEERFHLVSYATNDVVWDWDLLNGHVWRNQAIQRMFGYKDSQVTPDMNWWEERIHPDERTKVVRNIHTAIKNRESFWSKEYRFRLADGNYAYVFDRAYIIRDETGKPLRMLGAIMDITVRKQAEEIVRQESLHDPLTGLFNRRYMEEMLEREIRRAERTKDHISVIMLDVDHFKKVNDTFGHAAGDSLLHNLGVFLIKYIRGGDIACRYGGDEFTLILPGASLEVSKKRAEKIRREAENLAIKSPEELSNGFTLSLGVAMFPEQGSTPKEILAAADSALYAAKEAGRNQVVVAA